MKINLINVKTNEVLIENIKPLKLICDICGREPDECGLTKCSCGRSVCCHCYSYWIEDLIDAEVKGEKAIGFCEYCFCFTE